MFPLSQFLSEFCLNQPRREGASAGVFGPAELRD
jgi:hypothetical protein